MKTAHSSDRELGGGAVSLEALNRVVGKIAQRFDPEQIILFGSQCVGNTNADSDVDLLVIMESGLPRYKRSAPIRLLFKPTPFPMDLLVYTPDEIRKWEGTTNHIVTEALQSGKVLYERKRH